MTETAPTETMELTPEAAASAQFKDMTDSLVELFDQSVSQLHAAFNKQWFSVYQFVERTGSSLEDCNNVFSSLEAAGIIFRHPTKPKYRLSIYQFSAPELLREHILKKRAIHEANIVMADIALGFLDDVASAMKSSESTELEIKEDGKEEDKAE